MRKIVSFSCLLLFCALWTPAARAEQTTEVDQPAVSGSALPPAVDNQEQSLATSPPVSFKVDLTGVATPVTDSDQAAVARALKQYDDSMKSWTLPPESMREIIAQSRQAASSEDRFRLNRSYDVPPPRSVKDLEWDRQHFADRVADSIYPGFGRIERKNSNGSSSRIDYIDTHRCHLKGFGICWQYHFQ